MNEINPAEKLGRRNAVHKPASGKITGKATGKKAQQIADRVSISTTSKVETSRSSGSSEIRADLVAKYKQRLEEGTYTVKATELADKMVQKIRESKNRVII